MIIDGLSIGDLADRAGLSRRAIRFYIQRGLLEPPRGKGRSSEYDQSHVERLARIKALQEAGHSLEAVKQILESAGEPPKPATPPRRTSSAQPPLAASLWTRVQMREGVELHFDSTRFCPTVENLLALKQAIKQALGD